METGLSATFPEKAYTVRLAILVSAEITPPFLNEYTLFYAQLLLVLTHVNAFVTFPVDPLAQVTQAFREHLLGKALYCMAQPCGDKNTNQGKG